MANIFQQFLSQVGASSSASSASAVSAPSSASSGVAFSLQLPPNNALVSGSEKVFVAAPGGATVDASSSNSPVVIVGGTGTDHLVGGSANDVIVGGPGTNVMTGNGGTDTFGHQAGATDFISDFSVSAGEKIALQSGLTFTGSHNVTVTPATVGLPAGAAASSVQLTFSDGSTVTLVGSQDHPDSSWFI